MSLDAARFRAIIRTIHGGKLSAADAETIVAISQLAVDADGQEDPDEIAMFFGIGKAVFELAGIADAPTPTFAVDEDDRERAISLAKQLSTTAAKELAYAVSYVIVVADVELEPAESSLLDDLRDALGLSDDRAAELAEKIAAAITPGE